MPDIFDEAQRDYQAEQVQRALRRYGWIPVAAFVLALAGVGTWKFIQARQHRADLAIAEQFLPDTKQADTLVAGDKAGRIALAKKLVALADRSPAGYRTLARLRAAGLYADAGKLSEAQSLWDQVARDPAADPLLRQVASLLWVMRSLDTADANALRVRLLTQTTADDPFHDLAFELQALLDLRLGHVSAARALLGRLMADPELPTGQRGRDGAILTVLGD